MSNDSGRTDPERARYARLRAAFLSVMEANEAERAAAIARACGDDSALRAEIEELLRGAQDNTLFKTPTPEGEGEPEPSIVGTHVGSIRVEERLAEGGMGLVYRGFDERLRRAVALKSIRTEWRHQLEARARFLREARVLGQIKHPNICEIYGYEQTPGGDFLVLEYIDGKKLTDEMTALSSEARDRVIAAIVDVLRAAHGAGVVHRDLKPDNIMITRPGAVKVIDFGIARAEEAPDDAARATGPASGLGPKGAKTQAGDIIGTPHYMSPEQARGELATPASDLFSLGLIMYELYTGQRAYPRDLHGPALVEKLREGKVELSRELTGPRRRLVERLLATDPGERPTAAEVARELERIGAIPRRRLQLALAFLAAGLSVVLGVRYVTSVQAERASAEAARVQADAARAQADEARVQAERLVTLLLDELHDELLARARREVVDKVSREVLRYFEELPEPLRRGSSLRMARALRQYAEVQSQRGEPGAAREAYQRALTLDEQSVAASPEPEALAAVAKDLQEIAGIALFDGDPGVAAAFSKRGVEVYRQLVQAQPDDVRWQEALARCLVSVGWSQNGLGELAAGQAAFAEAAELYRRLVALDANRQPWRFALGSVLQNIAETQFWQGALDASVGSYEECIRILDALSASSPEVLDFAGFAAEARVRLAAAVARRGDPAAALDLIETARVALAKNQARDATRLRWTVSLHEADLFAARVLRQRHQDAAARARLERAAFPRPPLEKTILLVPALWAEIELERGHTDAARPAVEYLLSRGWHNSPLHGEFIALARHAGLLPEN